jgi:Tfp pilus assembly protein PilO
MKPATKRFISMLVSLFFLVAAVVVYFDFIQPLYSDIQKIRGDEASRENLSKTEQDAIKQVKDLLQNYQKQQNFQQAADQALPPYTDVGGLVAQISGMASANKLQVGSVTIGATSIETGSKQITSPLASFDFQVRVSGTYDDFKEFLRMVETNIRVIDVQDVGIQPSGKPESGLYNFDLRMVTYYQPNV